MNGKFTYNLWQKELPNKNEANSVDFKLATSLLTFIGPLDWLISFVSDPNEPKWRGFLYASLLFFSSMIISLVGSQSMYYSNLIRLKMRACMANTIYKKVKFPSNSKLITNFLKKFYAYSWIEFNAIKWWPQRFYYRWDRELDDNGYSPYCRVCAISKLDVVGAASDNNSSVSIVATAQNRNTRRSFSYAHSYAYQWFRCDAITTASDGTHEVERQTN